MLDPSAKRRPAPAPKPPTGAKDSDRVFSCGCGKAYLSYPALYTHVKNKHAGVFPIGSNVRKKMPSTSQLKSEHFKQDLGRFSEDFSAVFGQLTEQKDKKRADLKESLRKVGEGFEGEVQAFLDLNEKASTDKKATSIYGVLFEFLRFANENCAGELFEEYLLFVVFLAQALNKKGPSFVPKENFEKSFCESSNVATICDILNIFIAEDFPHCLKKVVEREVEKLSFLGFEEENIRVLIMMSKHLAQWMFHSGHVEYRLEINVDG